MTLLQRPIAILGLDGATWDLIDPLLAQGKLPNLGRLMEYGAYGRIATLPQYTSPALWATILTGKLSDQTGVRDFYSAAGRHLRVKPIYEILGYDPVGLFQMYASRWSPDRTGFLVPSRIEDAQSAYPEELEFVVDFAAEHSLAFARKLLRHGVPPWVIAQVAILAASRYLRLVDTEAWNLKTTILGQRLRSYIAAHLVKQSQPLFFASLFYTLDHLGHYYWRYWEPSRWANFQRSQVRRRGRVLADAYVEADQQIGRLLKALPSSGLIVVVSDHGMETASGEGGGKPLTIKGRPVLAALDLSNAFTTELLPPFTSVFRAKLPHWTSGATAQLLQQVGGATLADGTHPFQVSSPDIQSVIVTLSPNLSPRLGDVVSFPAGSPAPLSQYVHQHQEINGTHAPHGIMILSGEGVQRGVCLEDCALADVTPTLLALSGQPVARDMDGQVIEHAMEESFLARHPVQYIDTYEDTALSSDLVLLGDVEQKAIEARLRDLGYLV